MTASVDGFIGLGIWEEVSFGLSSQGTFTHTPPSRYDYLAQPQSYLSHRTSLVAQGRGGPGDRVYWAVGVGLGAVHVVEGPGFETMTGRMTPILLDTAPFILRIGAWQNRRPGRAQLFAAAQATLDLYWEEFPFAVFGLALHIGFGRV